MIISFSVENFGPIKDKVTLDFRASKSTHLEEYYVVEPIPGLRLLKLGLIYGANASGKTTVLKALDFVQELVTDYAENKNEVLNFQPFLLDSQSKQSPSRIELTFISNNVKHLYLLEFNSKAILFEELYRYEPKKSLVYSRSSDVEYKISTIRFGDKYKLGSTEKKVLESNTLWNQLVLAAYQKTNINVASIEEVIRFLRVELQMLVMPGVDLFMNMLTRLERNDIDKKDIIQFLSRADFNIKDLRLQEAQEERIDYVRIVSRFLNSGKSVPKISELIDDPELVSDKELFFLHEVKGSKEQVPISYNEQSEGTQRYFQMASILSLMLSNSLIFPIDELESSLHPDLLEHFLLTFLANAKRSQLIATSHYRELLMDRDIIRPDAIWFTEKKEDGSTDLFSLNDFDSSVVRKDTGSFYNAYKTGKLGARPNLKDYYIDNE